MIDEAVVDATKRDFRGAPRWRQLWIAILIAASTAVDPLSV
jgi:hypothetical protein